MLRSSLTRSSQFIAPAVRRRFMSEVPINQVARVTRTHVGNEENAMKADAILDGIKPELAKQPGYVKTKRTVCKAEWAYEVDIVFKDLDSFKGYMGSEFREKVALPAFEKVTALKPADAPEPYSGARVYDEY